LPIASVEMSCRWIHGWKRRFHLPAKAPNFDGFYIIQMMR
jgi:hypothetical protein